ncbi:PIN-like domain-containing protein [Flavobacterium sp. WG21]|uniref:PIN-like domain-containing protein n=1 Tax=Flavobacterium sp. WG21 TaxID=1229487 RepID=UPI0003466158|nr:PIN-like domain-containing protein [Flavobacterium sp. WG21]
MEITSNFCFLAKDVSILENQKALKFYSDGLENASSLEGDLPIFLDTNVLLDYYKISFSEREQLQKFFEINKDRIYLTKQIEAEFLRHRIDHIKSYLKSLEEFVSAYRNIKTEIEKLKIGEIKGFEHYLNNNPILKNDYQDLRNELHQFNETLKNKLKSLFQDTDFEQQIIEKEKKIEDIKKRLEGQADIERNDPLLDLIATFKVTNSLTESEASFLKSTYDILNNQYSNVKGDQNFNWKYTFPGCGEKNDKDDPYGDFIIYHEMLKFMKIEKSDIIFLTNDVEKNDWLLRNKAELLPYTHYIVNTYIATEKTMYIFQAKDKIRVSYQAIYVEEKTEESKEESDTFPTRKVVVNSPKIIGRIGFYEDDITFDEIDFDDFHFSSISESEFLQELNQSQKWAKKYGDNFIGTRSFVIKYLGSKGYNFRASYAIKDVLVAKGMIEEYLHKATNLFYNDVQAIKLTSEGLANAEKQLSIHFATSL